MSLYYKICRGIAKVVCPKRTVVRAVEDDFEPSIYVSNHSGMIGPVNMTLYYDKPARPWIISYVFDKEISQNFIFHDFLFGRSKKCKWFFRGLSKIMGTLLRPLLSAQNPILVYKNSMKVKETFNDSVNTLKEGKDVLIFAESHIKYSKFINEISNGFVDTARHYYKETKKCVKFYPVYIGNQLKTINIGEPIRYNPENTSKEERKRIGLYLQTQIDKIASALPNHKPVPFVTQDYYDYYQEFINDDYGYWNFVNQKHTD